MRWNLALSRPLIRHNASHLTPNSDNQVSLSKQEYAMGFRGQLRVTELSEVVIPKLLKEDWYKRTTRLEHYGHGHGHGACIHWVNAPVQLDCLASVNGVLETPIEIRFLQNSKSIKMRTHTRKDRQSRARHTHFQFVINNNSGNNIATQSPAFQTPHCGVRVRRMVLTTLAGPWSAPSSVRICSWY